MVSVSEETRRSYAALIAFFERNSPNMGKPEKRNRLSALSQFRTFCNAEADRIGEELGGEFEIRLQAFLAGRKGGARGTVRNLKSQLRAWKLLRDELVKPKAPVFKSLREATRYYFEQAKLADPTLTYAKLGLAAGMETFDVKRYLKTSDTFARRNLPGVQRLEAALHAPTGTLTAFVSQNTLQPNAELSEFGRRQAQLNKSLYRLTERQVHDQLRSEWRRYFDFKTDAVVMGHVKRHLPWRLRPTSEASINKAWTFPYVTTRDGKRYAATAQMHFEWICTFFGALANIEVDGNPGVMKYDPQAFSLAWMTDYRLIKECMDFLLVRFDGVYTNTMQQIFIICQTFLHRKFGYIRQQDEFRRTLLTPVSKARWTTWCDEQLALINEHLKQLHDGQKFQQTRNPFAPIWDYIQAQHPSLVLLQLAKNIGDYLDAHPLLNPTTALPLERTQFMVEMLIEQPVRLKMLYLMTYKPDNTGNLYQRADGKWALKFNKDDFKNERGAAQKPYDVLFSPDFAERIERYIHEIRPKFKSTTQEVFPTTRKKRRLLPVRRKMLEQSFRDTTKRFLPKCTGFGPHAVRHLVATDYIKNHESGWQTAADVLHDTLEVVRKAYAFLEAEDGHKFYKSYLSYLRTLFMEQQSGKHEHADSKEQLSTVVNASPHGSLDKLLALIERLSTAQGVSTDAAVNLLIHSISEQKLGGLTRKESRL